MSLKPGAGTPDDRPVPPTELDLYLDGLLTTDEAVAFERRLAEDETLRREVEAQRRIDARLRALFVPPVRIELGSEAAMARSAPVSHAGVDAALASQAAVLHGGAHAGAASGSIAGRVAPGRRRWIGLATAAGLALAVGVGGVTWWFVIGSPAPLRQPGEIWVAQAAGSFTPEWVCTTDEEFSQNVRERFGQDALLPMGTPGIEIVGWAYGTPVLTARTATLITRVEGREVLVLIDRADADVNLRRVGLPEGSAGSAPAGGLRLFKRRLGGLVLYEVTPFGSARVVPAFIAGN